MSAELYRHYDENGELLYVGVSLSTIQRLAQHRGSEWFPLIRAVKIDRFETRDAALAAEVRAIKTERPRYNIQHKKISVRPVLYRDIVARAEAEGLVILFENSKPFGAWTEILDPDDMQLFTVNTREHGPQRCGLFPRVWPGRAYLYEEKELQYGGYDFWRGPNGKQMDRCPSYPDAMLTKAKDIES